MCRTTAVWENPTRNTSWQQRANNPGQQVALGMGVGNGCHVASCRCQCPQRPRSPSHTVDNALTRTFKITSRHRKRLRRYENDPLVQRGLKTKDSLSIDMTAGVLLSHTMTVLRIYPSGRLSVVSSLSAKRRRDSKTCYGIRLVYTLGLTECSPQRTWGAHGRHDTLRLYQGYTVVQQCP